MARQRPMVSWHRGATPPQFFVERHLPEDPGDQLLDRPVIKRDWARMEHTAWAPEIVAGMGDGGEVLSPCDGTLQSGETVAFSGTSASSSQRTARRPCGSCGTKRLCLHLEPTMLMRCVQSARAVGTCIMFAPERAALRCACTEKVTPASTSALQNGRWRRVGDD